MHIIKNTNSATVCIDFQQNMYSCSKCVLGALSFACIILYNILYAMFAVLGQPQYAHMEQVAATLCGSVKMPQIQSCTNRETFIHSNNRISICLHACCLAC